MNGVETGSEMEGMVDRYLQELATALKRLPTVRRDQLIADIREHIAQLRAERPPVDRSDMEALLNRVGLPEDIAEVALEGVEEGEDETPMFPPPVVVSPRYVRLTRKAALITVACVVFVGLLSVVVLRSSGLAIFHRTGVELVGPQSVRRFVEPRPPVNVGPIVVPNVLGMSTSEAAAALAAARFSFSATNAPSTSVPAGQVVSQTPAAGSLLHEGSTVSLSISTGPMT
jgi:hypothetical protein